MSKSTLKDGSEMKVTINGLGALLYTYGGKIARFMNVMEHSASNFNNNEEMQKKIDEEVDIIAEEFMDKFNSFPEEKLFGKGEEND